MPGRGGRAEDTTLAPIEVTEQWFEKNRPEPKGYFVRYKDGYESYSPKAAFEDGYSLIARTICFEGGMEVD